MCSGLRQGEEVVVASDPDHEEEAVMDGKLVLGINPYREICTLHLAGTTYCRLNILIQSCSLLQRSAAVNN